MLNIKLPFKVPQNLKHELVEFVLNTTYPFAKNGRQRYGYAINEYINFDEIDTELSNKVKEFSDKVFDQMQMHKRLIEPSLGRSIVIMKNQGFWQTHIDQVFDLPNYHHIRINFLLQKPTTGGNPIIENNMYNIEEDESWFNLASMWHHSCTEIHGDRERITLSCGHLVEKKEANIFIKQLLETKT